METVDKSRQFEATEQQYRSISIKDLLRHSLVITISDERLDLFRKVFTFHGLEPLPEKLDGVCNNEKPVVENCKDSHKKAVMIAKERDWPYVCIFEDDAYPIIGIKPILSNYICNIPISCKVLILGNSNVQKCTPYNNRFCNNFHGWGSHAYIVFKDYYDRHMEFLDMNNVADYWQESPKYHAENQYFFSVRRNLFAQFTSNSVGIHKFKGYIILNSDAKAISDKEIMKRGFPRINAIIPTISDSPKPAFPSEFMF